MMNTLQFLLPFTLCLLFIAIRIILTFCSKSILIPVISEVVSKCLKKRLAYLPSFCASHILFQVFKFLLQYDYPPFKSCVVVLDSFIYSKLIGLQKALDPGVEFFQISSKLVDGESLSAYFRILNGTSDAINTLLYSDYIFRDWSEEKSEAILKAVFSSRAPSPITASDQLFQ
ncbi:hypothetical protein CVS40_9054 [Lucilia cuprina]|nr:hypothetical protein CVS40_9054 [Lucilia cuprina]